MITSTTCSTGNIGRVSEPTNRLMRKADEMFGDRGGAAVKLLRRTGATTSSWSVDSERVQAAALIISQGDWGRFLEALRLIELDWRDALVGAGLENDDWPIKLDNALGPR